MVSRSTLLVLVLSLVTTGALGAQQPARSSPSSRGVITTTVPRTMPAPQAGQQKAIISADSARTIALAQLPGARVLSEKLEREHGQQMYAFRLRPKGRKSVRHLYVNATNGQIVTKQTSAMAYPGQKRP